MEGKGKGEGEQHHGCTRNETRGRTDLRFVELWSMTTIIEEHPEDRQSNSRKCAAPHKHHTNVRPAMLSPVSITHSKTPILRRREEREEGDRTTTPTTPTILCE